MILAARQWGFLHSVPKNWPHNRMAQLRAERRPLGLPALEAGGYLIEAMFVMGPIRSGLNGEVAADWDIIDAFARSTGRISESWEAEALFSMCASYLVGLQDGADPLAISPVDQGDP